MDYRAYLESGKLESYVLGNCSTEDAQEAECMARVFPEVRKELELLRASLEEYALDNAVQPPAVVKSKIFAAITKDEQSSAGDTAKVVAMAAATKKSSGTFKYMTAACIALVVISGYLAFSLVEKNNRLATEQENLEKQQQDNTELQKQLAGTQEQLAVVSNPQALRVPMKGLPLSPQSLTTVYWDKASKQVYLSVNALPEPPPGKQYQLWAIVNGAPVDLGVLSLQPPGNTSLHKMKTVEGAAAFAITLENTGGSPTPTLTQMYVVGTI